METLSSTTTHCSSSYQNRYILLAGLSALLAFSFHASVNRRFSLMEDGLKTAATIRYAMEWDELMELEYHNEAYKHNQDSVRHLMLAFEYAHEAYLLQKNITREQQDIKDLEADAEEEKKRAYSDEMEASMWAIRAFGDGRTTVGAELTGIELAKRAYDENERGQEALEHANQTLVAGTEKLHQAQEALQFAEEDKNHTKIDKGICHWMPVACNIVRGHASPNATYPATPTDMAIQANKDLQDALQQIQDAKLEKDLGMELLINASAHANLSTEILKDAEMFRAQANIDRHEANKYRTQEMEDERQYDEDEKEIKEEIIEIADDKKRLHNYTNTSKMELELASLDHIEFRQAAERYQSSRQRAIDMETLLISKTMEAKLHVSKAGWSALAAIVAGSCLLTAVSAQIIAAFRYQQPLHWIVRGPPDTGHDLLYLANHVFIFVLSIGYVGELLVDFGHEKKIARAAIVFLFAVMGAIMQVTLLLFVPHVCRMLLSPSRLDWGASRVLFREDIVKKGILMSIVFACEMLLLWVNMGTVAFTGAYKLNNWWCWTLLVVLAACYSLFVLRSNFFNRQLDMSEYLGVFDTISSVGSQPLSTDEISRNSVKVEEEKQSLLAKSSIQGSLSASHRDSVRESVQGSIMSSASPEDCSHPNPPEKSSSSSSSMRSVPLASEEAGYGATEYSHISIVPEIRASFVRSWSSEFQKIRLLFEILLASWAVWIVRRNIELIIKLAPLVKGVAWGRCPLWILNVFFLVGLAIFAMSYQRKSS